MPYRKFNLTVGELAPLLDCWSETAPGRLLDDFGGFAASRFKGQREPLLLPRAWTDTKKPAPGLEPDGLILEVPLAKGALAGKGSYSRP
jgi:hypothetical protein